VGRSSEEKGAFQPSFRFGVALFFGVKKALDPDIMGRLIVASPTPKGEAMVTFQVNDMTCGNCASAISRAVAAVDKNARLDIRIQQKLVRVDSSASVAELAEAIQDAGYTPRDVREELAQAAAPWASSGCGCGTQKAAPVDARQQVSSAAGSCCS
jgi:copper chaperone